MERRRAFVILAAVLAVAAAALPASAADPAGLFPELDGWSKDGGVATFRPDNLFEHINGAAEGFLAYGFQGLAVQNYANAKKQALSAEIYHHGTPENAFGIYSSEKPQTGDYLRVGAQGYAEEGVLNFISDSYYVKLNGFDLGPGGAASLRALAEKIVVAIDGRNDLPAALAAFPALGKAAHSERYFPGNFLGHEFLGAAFTADYVGGGRNFRLFLIDAGDEARARAMLQRWAALDKGFAGEVKPGGFLLNDPYNGPLRLRWQGAHVWGAVDAGDAADALLEEMARNLQH